MSVNPNDPETPYDFEPVPDIVAHEHECPVCEKITHCTLDECVDEEYILCMGCDEEEDYDV